MNQEHFSFKVSRALQPIPKQNQSGIFAYSENTFCLAQTDQVTCNIRFLILIKLILGRLSSVSFLYIVGILSHFPSSIIREAADYFYLLHQPLGS